MRCIACVTVLAMTLFACGDDDDENMATPDAAPDAAEDVLPPPPEGEGFQLTMETTAPAGEEIWHCMIYDSLPGDQAVLNVQWAESLVTDGIHHADLMTMALTGLSFEPGMYDCNELYTMNRDLMEKGLFIYGTQSRTERVDLPEGYVAPLPRNSQYMMEVHYVNTTDEDVDVSVALNAYTIPQSSVEGSIWGDANRDFNLVIPPGTPHVEWTRCKFPEAVNIIFLQSHTHELAQKFEIRRWDGTLGNPGTTLIYENDDWKSPHLQVYTDLQLQAGEGFEYKCEYESDRQTETNWGFAAADEMCQFGYVYTVPPGGPTPKCETAETSDGIILDSPVEN